MSEAIRQLVAMAEARGLNADAGQWSKVYVYWFDAPMPSDIRAVGCGDPGLEYHREDAAPHTQANEGFIDRQAMMSITFLLQGAR
jgi:hypothetical protein